MAGRGGGSLIQNFSFFAVFFLIKKEKKCESNRARITIKRIIKATKKRSHIYIYIYINIPIYIYYRIYTKLGIFIFFLFRCAPTDHGGPAALQLEVKVPKLMQRPLVVKGEKSIFDNLCTFSNEYYYF